jgi:hypothetical protein
MSDPSSSEHDTRPNKQRARTSRHLQTHAMGAQSKEMQRQHVREREREQYDLREKSRICDV